MRISRILSAGRSVATAAVISRGEAVPRLRELCDPRDGEPTPPAQDLARAAAVSPQADRGTLGAGLARGDLSAWALTHHLLGALVTHDDPLRSCTTLEPDAPAQARAADARLRAGHASPLLGVPVMIKDNIEVGGGAPTTAGAALLADHVPGRDADLVTGLRRAGAVILARANLSEFAGAVVRTPGFSAVAGQGHNPYGVRFTPGGSSSGSAVAVAAGLCPASVGTETSGSLIAPAAFNGLVAIKPTAGLVSTTGVVPLVAAQDCPGPIARCVADAALLLDAMAAQPLGARLCDSALTGVRVGVLAADILGQATRVEDTADNPVMLARIRAGLVHAGAHPVDVTTDEPAGFSARMLRLVLGGLTHDTMGYLTEVGAAVHCVADLHAYNLAHPRTRIPRGQFLLTMALLRDIDHASYASDAFALRAQAAATLDAAFLAAQAPVLASISTAHSPLYATAEYPAITVPLGLRAGGMPTGITLIGRSGTDPDLLGWAHAFERATRLRVAPPAGPGRS